MTERGESGCRIDRISRIETARLHAQKRIEYGPIWPDTVNEPIEKEQRKGNLYQIDVV